MRWTVSVVLPIGVLAFLAPAHALCAQETGLAEPPPAEFPRVAPKSPEEALKTFKVLGGFHLELVAAEPLITDPVDLAYDENGRAYVVEMRDYPFPEKADEPPAPPTGRVTLLDDEDGDGVLDRSSVFADQLSWPTSVVLWKRGIFVAAAPDLWYFEDIDGDRRADIRQKVFTGFSRYNVQAIMNNLRWGPDHWIYGAASGNGGTITSVEHPDSKAVPVTRKDFRFSPSNGGFEAVSGSARFGHSFDDWGQRFLCNIRNPVQHVVLPAAELARNPLLTVPKTIHDAAESGEKLPVYRISPPEPWREFRAQRWVREGSTFPRSELVGSGFFTSSSGVTVYRGSAYPRAYHGNVFVADVASNIVHREILEEDGVTFKARRADENAEFISSTDNWFRPVNFVNAPDGTLHILDMYRETIEHPWSIPDDIRAKLDLASGNDRGRIYRLVPPDASLPRMPRLKHASTAELVGYLESPHAWWRETADRLLYEQKNAQTPALLRQFARTTMLPQARVHVLYLLDSFAVLSYADLLGGLTDSDPHVREVAVRLCQPRLMASIELRKRLLTLARDDSPRVRFQLALALGAVPTSDATDTLAALARRDAGDEWQRTAILSSSYLRAPDLLKRLTSPCEFVNRREGLVLLRQLALTAGGKGGTEAKAAALLLVNPEDEDRDWQFSLLAGLGEGLARRKADFAELDDSPAAPAIKSLLDAAADVAQDADAPLNERLEATQLLKWQPLADAGPVLAGQMAPQQPVELQTSALQVLCSSSDSSVARLILDRWRLLSPSLKAEALDRLLSRPVWQTEILTAIENGELTASLIPPARFGLMLNSKDDAIKARATKLRGVPAPAQRIEALALYAKALHGATSREQGQAVFKRECAQCHRLGNEGSEVGPGIASFRHRAPDEILLHILDPNREVSPAYLDHTVTLEDGRVLTGLIASETDSSVTLRRAQKVEDTVPRSQIDELASSGKSLMPEGLEQRIKPQEMADLILYLKQPD